MNVIIPPAFTSQGESIHNCTNRKQVFPKTVALQGGRNTYVEWSGKTEKTFAIQIAEQASLSFHASFKTLKLQTVHI